MENREDKEKLYLAVGVGRRGSCDSRLVQHAVGAHAPNVARSPTVTVGSKQK